MSYYDEIDPIGEELPNICLYCKIPCTGMYCCNEHKNVDVK